VGPVVSPHDVQFDDEAITACADLVGRSGATSFIIGYLHEGVPIAEAGWYAHAQYHGARLICENQRGPAEAAEGLSARLLDGARCVYCSLPVVTGDGEGCRWHREGARWEPGCEGRVTHTNGRLARALAAIPGVPQDIIHRALDGYYHDYLSPLALPELALVSDLESLAKRPATPRDSRPLLRALAERVKAGDYDATKAESDAWASSPEGQAVMQELFGEEHDGDR